jgi:hypothetical protein
VNSEHLPVRRGTREHFPHPAFVQVEQPADCQVLVEDSWSASSVEAMSFEVVIMNASVGSAALDRTR